MRTAIKAEHAQHATEDKWNSKKNVLQAITEFENDINNVKLSTCTISKAQTQDKCFVNFKKISCMIPCGRDGGRLVLTYT